MSKFEGNAVTWFEIPTADIDRATKFYETLLAANMIPYPGDEPYAIFPAGESAERRAGPAAAAEARRGRDDGVSQRRREAG